MLVLPTLAVTKSGEHDRHPGTLSLSCDYVVAAQTRGESTMFICLVEILPNARGPLIVDFCLRMGYTTITIGALGFLGLGLPPPDPDWGGMITETRAFITGGFPHMAIIPAITISLLVLGFNMLADGSFTYAPPANQRGVGADSFTYTLSNGAGRR